jgi:hypothetical protein
MHTYTPEQEKEILTDFFAFLRTELADYLLQRNLILSNSQLFGFVLISPATIAIASDGNLDMTEITMLVDLASYFERGSFSTDFDLLTQPQDHITDKQFKKIAYSELKFLCLNMKFYEENLLSCLRKLLEIDEKISLLQNNPKFSVKIRVREMMNSVIYNNLGVDEIEENKLKNILKKLGIEEITTEITTETQNPE